MPLYTTPDGRYTVAWETAGEGDGNSVIYDRGPDLAMPWPGSPIWNRFTYEANLGSTPGPITPSPAPPGTAGPTPVPTPIPDAGSQPVPPASVRVIQVTNESDGQLDKRIDASRSRAFLAGRSAYVFAGHADGHPRFFQVDIVSGAVERLGPLVGFTSTSEDWYWDHDGWIYLLDGPRLRRVSPFTNEAPVVFDISDTHPGCHLWQPHSSDDGRVHSATVQQNDQPYAKLGTVVYHNGREVFFDAHGDLDESQITPDGGWVVIKETFPAGNDKVDLTNRVIAIPSRETQVLHNVDGAVGHSDCGQGVLVGEWSPQFDTSQHGQCVKWDLTQPLTPGRRLELFPTWNMGHVSVRNGRCLLSDPTHIGLVSLNGGGVVQLFAHGMVAKDYDHQVQGNLDHTGTVACYLLDQGGRWDLFLAVLPA